MCAEHVEASYDGAHALTRAVAAGEPRAVAQLYETRFDVVLSVAKKAGFDEQRAMDVVQDTFMKAVRAMPSIASDGALDAWLRRIALRTALDHLRAERRRSAREHASAKAPANDQDERISALREELGAMKRSTIELLQLRYQGGLTLDAIARRIGSTTGAVDGRLRRAAALLRSKLSEDDA